MCFTRFQAVIFALFSSFFDCKNAVRDQKNGEHSFFQFIMQHRHMHTHDFSHTLLKIVKRRFYNRFMDHEKQLEKGN